MDRAASFRVLPPHRQRDTSSSRIAGRESPAPSLPGVSDKRSGGSVIGEPFARWDSGTHAAVVGTRRIEEQPGVEVRSARAQPTAQQPDWHECNPMTIPTWMLIGFAGWTILLLASTIGVYRWALIFAGRAAVNGFRADQPEGADWYKRAMRAHANCIENLPVFGAIVFALQVSGTGGTTVDMASIAVLAARVMQSLVHVSLPQTSAVVGVRFSFLMVQLVGFAVLIAAVVRHAAT
jgi:uncharacterized MAPEG superfamily protein